MTHPADAWQTVLEERRGAPAWLARQRRAALDRFREQGYPTPRLEAWRTTNVAAVARTSWADASPPGEAMLARARRLLAALPRPRVEAARFVVVNGHLVPALSVAPPIPGLTVGSLARRADTVEDRLGRLVDPGHDPFAALNTALWADGLLLHVERGTALEVPVHVVLLSMATEAAVAAHPRLLVRAEEGSRAAVLLTWAGDGDGPFLSNGAAEVWVEPNARLDLLEVQGQPRSVHHLFNVAVHQARDSRFHGCCLALGSRLARADLGVTLGDEGAACRLDGVTLVTDRQHADVRTSIDHAQPHGTSEQLFKSILDGHATAAFGGRVLVRPHAQRTDARQANHNLLLSRDARSDSKPELEILADDVKCAHGATVGQLDEEALFYLRSRGIGHDAARALLVRAFAADVANRVEHPVLAAHAHAEVEAALARTSRV